VAPEKRGVVSDGVPRPELVLFGDTRGVRAGARFTWVTQAVLDEGFVCPIQLSAQLRAPRVPL
jgi:hypothetical protein